ncbi:MAG: cysteine--tRNA ligase [Proteobacteria bacterium]|nr:cysteine--tRNA ligase [Pseudomonadota bacterium]
MALEIYNSLTRRKEQFVPADPARVTMYACGPTVYNPPHIGNARAAVVYDLLYRVLKRHYPNVVYARNITDVDDKINAAAADEGVEIGVITDRYTAVYHADVEALGTLPPPIEPRATAHIGDIIAMIEALIAAGHAYAAEGHVLFNVPSYAAYGALSGRSQDEMIAGARVEVAPYKRDPADFVLWKPSSPELPGWDSPWGRGRPGWHMECSAMIEHHLGRTIDIHGGGNDLKFPHHENEIAQSTCAHGGAPLARYWVHNGFVQIDSTKMSKSIGNVLLVRELLKQHNGETLRMALIRAKYREPLNWNDELVEQAKSQLDRMYGTLERLADIQLTEDELRSSAAFNAAMDDDLNTPKAVAVLMETVTLANRSEDAAERRRCKAELLAGGRELGILQHDPVAWAKGQARVEGADDAAIDALVAERVAARAAKDWKRADEVRDQLQALGIQIMDGANGTQWRRG